MVAQPNRLPDGGRIDRSRPLRFSFNGKSLEGYHGDTLASALLANGISLVGRSVKYHRPRGIVGAGAEEPNAIVQTGTGATTEPALRATQVELYDGLVARTTRGWPSLAFDVMAVNDRMGGMLGAGFYYKTFMQPPALWHHAEHLIRKAGGLGVAPGAPDPDLYSHCNAHCDVLVAGAGPAGLMAALAAGRAGARVILADDGSEPGGRLLTERHPIDARAASEWLSDTLTELAQLPTVTLLPRSTVFGYYDYNFLTVMQNCTGHLSEHQPGDVRQRLWRVRARRVVLAQGAFERPLVFSNNDRPGVMIASAVSTYINRYGVLPGKRAVVFTNNDSAYQTAQDLRNAGALVAVVDSRAGGAALSDPDMRVLNRHVVTDVKGTKRVRGVTVYQLGDDGKKLTGKPQHFACDLVAVSGGWSPAVHLHSQAGGKNRWDETLACFVPADTPQNNVSAGACNGRFELDACLAGGIRAGTGAALDCGFEVQTTEVPQTASSKGNALEALWRVPSKKPVDACPKQFLDFQNDATVADIHLATREGYESVEHVKRYTALGFGTDQGKLGNINGMAVLAGVLGKTIPEVGTTTFRPAYTPVTFGACAGEDVGELYEPVRKTALHAWHEAAGAQFEVVGQWLRPRYFPQQGEDMDAAVRRECLAVRNGVGMMDASTLGKIEVSGPDARTFLEMLYTHNIGRLKPGRCAYGILLGEDGMIMDDGVMACTGKDRYYLTTTTGGAATVFSWLERWRQTEWPHMQVYFTSVTDHWAAIAVAGPHSRKLLQTLDSDIDFGAEAFSFMTLKSGTLAGLEVRVFRISFSGELAFEVNVNADHANALWQTLVAAGEAFDLTPYGTESMHVLRAEKGFVIVGQDTDGSVTPVDAGMHWLLAKDKDFLGKRSLSRSDCLRKDRKQLVGLKPVDGTTVVPEGCALADNPAAPLPIPIIGHVTSAYSSPVLGYPIALALVKSGRARKGETVYAMLDNGASVAMDIASPVFYDPKGERQHV